MDHVLKWLRVWKTDCAAVADVGAHFAVGINLNVQAAEFDGDSHGLVKAISKHR